MEKNTEKYIEKAVTEENWEEVFRLAQEKVYENDTIQVLKYHGVSDDYTGYVARMNEQFFEYDLDHAKEMLQEDLGKYIDSLFNADVENRFGVKGDDLYVDGGYYEKVIELAGFDVEDVEEEAVIKYHEEECGKGDSEKQEALENITNYYCEDYFEDLIVCVELFTDEELKEAEWDYYEDQTTDCPRAEATATINGYEVTVGFLWAVHELCYVRINDNEVDDDGICEHFCEVVEKAIGKELTGLSYELWKEWVEYHGLYENWEDMDEDERYELYKNAIIKF